VPDAVPNLEHVQAVPTDDQTPGWVLGGRYRVTDRLGAGGTAEVFRAHDELLDRDVAVKVFRTAAGEDEALFGAARRDAELQSLARLNHPNLIRLLDGAVGGDDPSYLVLDLVCGPDLVTRLRGGPLPEPEVRAIGRQIADALDYAHGQGMVHRDVKPANILLGADGPDGAVWARLSDFGTVRVIDGAQLTAADLTLGTASYIAPEQARGADVGPAADVYSLGLVLLEALTGKRSFDGAPHEVLAARLAAVPAVPDALPDDLRSLLSAMTTIEPELRPTAAEVAESLQARVPPSVAAAADADATTSMRPALVPDAAAKAVPAVAGTGRPVHHAGRGSGGLLFALAGLTFAALLAGAAFFMVGNTAQSDTNTTIPPHMSTTRSNSPAHHPPTHRTKVHVGGQPRPAVQTPAHPTAARATHTTSGERQTASARAPATSSSAASTAPKTSSSAAPSSSAASSATPSASPSAPPSTSPAPSTSTETTTGAVATP